MANNKINITDISKLKITKVKPWKLYFEYDNTEYMLIDDTDEDAHISLYKRHKLPSGNHRVECINGAITCMGIHGFIRDISKKRPEHLVYANIDRNYFVLNLIELGFSTGYLEGRHKKFMARRNNIQEEINKLQLKITKLQDENKKLNKDEEDGLPKLGSKTARGDRIKREMAERVHGKKDGEWCEEYNDYYGNSDRIYGGKLTDLYNLPVGTFIQVANGAWSGIIDYNEHGDKGVNSHGGGFIKLTKDHHSLYLE